MNSSSRPEERRPARWKAALWLVLMTAVTLAGWWVVAELRPSLAERDRLRGVFDQVEVEMSAGEVEELLGEGGWTSECGPGEWVTRWDFDECIIVVGFRAGKAHGKDFYQRPGTPAGQLKDWRKALGV